jgi:hypothetical protein
VPYNAPSAVTFDWNNICGGGAGCGTSNYLIPVDDVTGISVDDKFVLVRRASEDAFFVYNKLSVNLIDDGHFIFDGITVHSSPGLVFGARAMGRVFVRDCRIEIKGGSGRIQTSNADATHFQSCRRGPEIIRNDFSAMADDGSNNYARGHRVLADPVTASCGTDLIKIKVARNSNPIRDGERCQHPEGIRRNGRSRGPGLPVDPRLGKRLRAHP